MKTSIFFRTLMFAVTLVCISAVASYAVEPVTAPVQKLQKIIKENIKYPDQAIRECCTGWVDVYFTVNEDGKINIEKMVSENDHVKKMVQNQLSDICCKAAKVPSFEHYKIRITFALIG